MSGTDSGTQCRIKIPDDSGFCACADGKPGINPPSAINCLNDQYTMWSRKDDKTYANTTIPCYMTEASCKPDCRSQTPFYMCSDN